MITVDSSVWIARMRGQDTPAVAALARLIATEPIVVGDLVLMALLQGARDEAHAARIEAAMRRFRIVPMLNEANAIQAARHYRILRATGITVRKTADLIIATWCVRHDCALLHDDQDFGPMTRHLGLRAI